MMLPRRPLLCAASLLAFPALARAQGVAGAPPAAAPATTPPAPAAPAPPAAAAGIPPAPVWGHQQYLAAMEASGRPVNLSEGAFRAIQARRPDALRRIENYLRLRLGAADPEVMRAFSEVPREYFHYDYANRRASPGEAYESNPKPWAIGFGSALSDYLGQAYMTQVCEAKPDHTVLEIGTGSGFQSALLSRMVRRQYSIEIIEPLGRGVAPIFAPLGFSNVETRVGDGFFGWPEVQGGFDVIIVTCAAQYVPPALLQQLKPGGRMVIPIGQPFRRGQVLYIYTKDAEGRVRSRVDMGVYFIPMTGAMMRTPRPAGTN